MLETLFKATRELQQGVRTVSELTGTISAMAAAGLLASGDSDGNETTMLSQPGPPGAPGAAGLIGPTMLMPPDAADEPALILVPGPKGDKGEPGVSSQSLFEDTCNADSFVNGPTPLAPNVYFPVMATVRNSVAQVLASGAYASITFDTEAINVGPFHSTGTNPARFTVPTGGDGMYIFSASAAWAGPGGTQYDARYLKNGATIIGSIVNTPLNNGNWNIVTIVPLVGGDYVEFQMYQDSGVNMNVSVTGNNQVTGMRLT